jgi:hypothetical protein
LQITNFSSSFFHQAPLTSNPSVSKAAKDSKGTKTEKSGKRLYISSVLLKLLSWKVVSM